MFGVEKNSWSKNMGMTHSPISHAQCVESLDTFRFFSDLTREFSGTIKIIPTTITTTPLLPCVTIVWTTFVHRTRKGTFVIECSSVTPLQPLLDDSQWHFQLPRCAPLLRYFQFCVNSSDAFPPPHLSSEQNRQTLSPVTYASRKCSRQ